MILQALTAYYEALAKEGKISRSGWGLSKIAHALEIDAEGALVAVLPLKVPADDKGKRMRPREMELPAPIKRASNIDANFLWDNAAYLLGIDSAGKPERTLQCFEASKALHLSLLSGTDDPFARAICTFFTAWDPATAQNHPLLVEHLEAFSAGENLVWLFRDAFPSDNAALAKAWQVHYDGEATGETMRCLVTGERAVPEAIHPSIKNVQDAQSSGAALVSFNAQAFCSYERDQNLNAPVSRYAAFAYTTTLNHLLADRKHRTVIGDTTVVYWAENAQTQAQDAFACFMGAENDTVTDEDLKAIMDKLASGGVADWGGLPLEPDNRFYVLGLAPNAARISVRFFLQDSFGNMVRNLCEHDRRLEIVKPAFEKEALPLWKLLRETVNLNSRDKSASPQMAGDTLRAILTGGRYPATLYQGVQLRIRAERTISRGRAAIIKAYLLRNAEHEIDKEVLTVKLNEATTYQPYVLGRLFSVLEAIQESANQGINTTIKDKYLSSACATPGIVFPTLLNLAQKHLRKLEGGQSTYYAKQLGELTMLIVESYPAHHSLYDQGIFQLGYYHQTQKRYEKKSDAKPSTAEE